MNYCIDQKTFEREGRTFLARVYHDPDHGAPWDESDGHGVIREADRSGWSEYPDKRPGERLMYTERRHDTQYVYDIAATLKLAKKDGWGLGPEDLAKLEKKLGRKATPGEVRVAAVERDFDYCNRWLRDDWQWIGVSTVLVTDPEEDPEEEYQHACWGIESEGDYWEEVANEQADEILYELKKEEEQQAKEQAEAAYWASRDVETVP